MTLFLSTPSARRATDHHYRDHRQPPDFYPRPPRGGRRWTIRARLRTPNFYPRPPRGGRRTASLSRPLPRVFLPTPSARRATSYSRNVFTRIFDFYPRPPRGGRPLCSCRSAGLPADFYPRPPRGGRPERFGHQRNGHRISIHALREEGDLSRAIRPTRTSNFYPRPPRGGRQQKQRQNLYFQTNYTTFCTNLEEP